MIWAAVEGMGEMVKGLEVGEAEASCVEEEHSLLLLVLFVFGTWLEDEVNSVCGHESLLDPRFIFSTPSSASLRSRYSLGALKAAWF